MKKHLPSQSAQKKDSIIALGAAQYGTSLGFLMDYEKLTFVEAIEELAKMLGMEVPKSSEDIKITKKQTNLKSLLNEVSDYFQSNLKSSKNAIEYLKDRGDGKTAKEFCIGYSKNSWDDLTKKYGSTEKQIDLMLEAGLIIKKTKVAIMIDLETELCFQSGTTEAMSLVLEEGSSMKTMIPNT